MQSCYWDMRTVREQCVYLARMSMARRGRAKGQDGFWARNSATQLFVSASSEVSIEVMQWAPSSPKRRFEP